VGDDVVYANTPYREDTLSQTLKAWSNRYKSKKTIKAVMK
jgi:hypothetical protein